MAHSVSPHRRWPGREPWLATRLATSSFWFAAWRLPGRVLLGRRPGRGPR